MTSTVGTRSSYAFGVPELRLTTTSYVVLGMIALHGHCTPYGLKRAVGALNLVVYRRRKHLINLFVWPSEARAEEKPVELNLRGYSLIYWTRSGMNYAAVSDINPTDLRDFRQALQD